MKKLLLLFCTIFLFYTSSSLAEAMRLISLSPSITQTVDDLGCADRLVGITSYCSRPKNATEAILVGTLTSPDLERIVRLQPDRVLMDRESNPQRIADSLREAGVNSTYVGPTQTLDDLIATCRQIASIVDATPIAEIQISETLNRLNTINRKIHQQKPRRVFIEIWPKPLKTASNQSFIHEVFNRAGAINIFADLPIPYPVIALESVITQKPDCIAILTHSLISRDRIDFYRQYSSFADIDIRQIDASSFTQPNLDHFVESVLSLAEWLHPEAMKSEAQP